MKKSLTTNQKAHDVLFLDANILFSAAYKEKSGLLRLWSLKETGLITSAYALDEARRNLKNGEQRSRLDELVRSLAVTQESSQDHGLSIDLPQKDRPILIAAMKAKATHLITGDFRDFGRYYRQKTEGVIILPPAEYLKGRP